MIQRPDRRTFVSVISLGLLATPLAAEGQQKGKVRRVGVRMQTPGFYRTNPSQAEATRDAIFAVERS